MATLAAISVTIRSTTVMSATLFLQVVQPLLAIMVGGIAFITTRELQDRVRHRNEKALIIGSVIAIWFVFYFMSGLATSYVNNSLVSSPKSLLINVWSFGAAALAIEYTRHRVLLVVGRRNVVWFGAVVAIVLAVQQINFGLVVQSQGLIEFIKLAISDIVPAIIASFLLTYLAITSGLKSVLTYRLGLVAIVVLPPIIPKYDWYLQGVSLVILAISVYIAVDRSRQDHENPHRRRVLRNPRRSADIMTTIVLVFLAMFMTGFFAYSPSAIVSNSMKPVYSRGALVIVQKIKDPMDVAVGDIVQYRRSDKKITHRVVAIEPASDGSGKRVFTTKGDNSPSVDPPVAESQLMGIIRAQIPYVGYPTVWLSDLSKVGK